MRYYRIALLCTVVFFSALVVLESWMSQGLTPTSASVEAPPLPVIDEVHVLPDLTPRLKKRFRSALLKRTNQYRRSNWVGQPIKVDHELEAELERMLTDQRQLSHEGLSELLNELNRRFPSAHALAAQVEVKPDDATLGTALSDWSEAHSSDFDSMSLHLFNRGRQRGGLLLLSRRLPEFSTARYDSSYDGPYHQKCLSCSTSYATRLEAATGAGYLACPSCREVFAIVVGTPDGRVRHASDFFEEFAFPLFSRRSDPYGTLLEVWRRVLEEVDYKLDEDTYDRALDVWKSPSETWEDRGGDCEDTSILLCDALLSAGVESRVVVGISTTDGEPEGHAWVVAKVGNRQYLLESTGDPHLLRQPLRVESEAEDYQPVYQFDREAIYLVQGGKARECDDYWTDTYWSKRDSLSPQRIVSASRVD